MALEEFGIVLEALTKAASQDSDLIKAAEHVLKSLETKKSYYSILLTIACDPSYEVIIRLSAILCFKNGVDRFWRKTAPNAIEEDEKDFIRQKLLTCFNEPINPIAIQFGVVISKVARHDFPAAWPQLIPIIQELSTPNVTHCYPALYTLKLIAKSLASKCIKPERRKFQELTASIFPNLVAKWNLSSTFVLTCGVENLNNVPEHLKTSIVLLKILKILVVDGFENVSDSQDAKNFINMVFHQIEPFLQFRYNLKCSSTQFDSAAVQNLLEAFEKYIVLHVKIISRLFDIHEQHFDPFVIPTLQCCTTFLLADKCEELLFERLTVQLFNLLKKMFVPKGTSKRSVSFHEMNSEFFSQEVLQFWLCDKTLDKYLVLSQQEVENWIADPEAFATEEATETWQYNLRPCAESFFMSLFQYLVNKSTILPVLIEKIRTVQNTPLPRDAPGILKRDAVYNAAGLAVYSLFNEIDFDEWFEILLRELKEDTPLSPILRRRIIWLFGQWVGVDMKAENRPRLFEVVSHCLGPGENLLVRLAAADTLRNAVDEYEFHQSQFLPFLDTSLAGLFQLLEQLKECDLMMTILQTLTLLIERMETSIRSYQNEFRRCLPRLWEGSAQHNMLRCGVVACATQLVEVLGSMSESWQPFLVPVVCFCVDLNEPAHVYLLEDGIALWRALLENAPRPSDILMQAARFIFPIIETRYEILRTSCEVVIAYIILTPEAFLRSYGENLMESMFAIASDVKDEGICHLTEIVTYVFLASPVDGPVFFEKFMDIILEKMLDGDNQGCSQHCLTLLCRVIFANVECFARIVRKRAVQANADAAVVLEQFVEVATRRVHLMSCDKKRKMVALGLLTLLNTQAPVVLYRICGILLVVVEVLHDITLAVSSSDQDEKLDSLVIPNDQPVSREFADCNSDEFATEQCIRKKEVTRVDPVHKVVLKEYLGLQMAALEKSMGTEKFQELMNTVDFETKQQIAMYLDPVDTLCTQLNTHTIE